MLKVFSVFIMSVYVKSFGLCGSKPAKIWNNKELNKICEWKTKEITNKKGEKYIQQYACFPLKVSYYQGKDNDGKPIRTLANDILVLIKDKNIYDMLEKMEENDVDYYDFYGSISINSFDIIKYKEKDGKGNFIKTQKGEDLLKPAITTEFGELNNFNFKIVPHWLNNNNSSNQQTEQVVSEEYINNDVDDDIPF